MRQSEIEMLTAFQIALSKVPFPTAGSGTQSATPVGFVWYSEDMRQFVPMAQKFCAGMVYQSHFRKDPDMKEYYEEGWDYHDPALVLRAIQEWIKVRGAQNWQSPPRGCLDDIYKKMREEREGAKI